MLSTDFYYNGQRSVDMGIYLVSMSTDFLVTPFLANKEIIEEAIIGRDEPYYYGVKYQPLVLKLTLSCLEGIWTYDKRRELARWLNTSTYELFYSTDDIQKWYYCQYVGGIDLNHTGSLQGYIDIEMRCNSRYTYSPIIDKRYDLSTNTEPLILELGNDGDLEYSPQMWITMAENGGVKIENLTDGYAKPFEFTGLVSNETVYIDNENEIVETDLSNTYRYSNFNDNYLVLKRGVNRLKITGKCLIIFRLQFKTIG